MPLLQSAELQENRIQEIASNAFINVPHLLFLNLSHNHLPSLDYVGLESLRSLEVLDLSNNRLSRVSSNSLASMEWLVELKVSKIISENCFTNCFLINPLIRREVIVCEQIFCEIKHSRVKMNRIVVIKIDFRNDSVKRKRRTKIMTVVGIVFSNNGEYFLDESETSP